MVNPYYCYIVSFGFAIGTYSLGWSELYPRLSVSLFIFLFVTFIFHFVLGRRILANGIVRFTSIEAATPVLVTIFIYLLWTADFVYEGGIPLFKILFNIPYNYRTFGVPSLHVFTVTFSSFYTVYLFQVFLSQRSKKIGLLCLINLLAALLIYNRGMFFINLTSSFFIYLIFLKGIYLRTISIASVAVVVLLFLFGLLGSLRVSRESNKPYNNEEFMETGKATETFRQSVIPKEYFWTYIYISSPLANLQQNIDQSGFPDKSWENIGKLMINELLPDFLSKRINSFFQLQIPTDQRIPGPFNASTLYSRAFNYARWPGMILIALSVLGLPFLYLKLMPPSSKFFLSGWAILCTMFLFFSFDNALRFTGLSFQLVYPLLLNWFDKKFRFKV